MEFSARCRQAIAEFFRQSAQSKAMGHDPNDTSAAMLKTLKMMNETPRAMDKAAEYFTNSLISGVATPMVNAFSIFRMVSDNAVKWIQGGLNDASRAIGAKVDPMAPGIAEAKAFTHGTFAAVSGMREILAYGWKGLAAGQPLDVSPDYVNKAIGMGSINPDGTIKESSKAEKVAGEIIRAPSRVAVGIDELMKAYYRRVKAYELLAKVQNRYSDDVLSKKGQTREQLINRLRDVIDNPNEERNKGWHHTLQSIDPDAYDEVVNFAKKQTFQEEPPEMVKAIMAYKEQHPIAAFFVPFVRTPYNITKQGVEYIPGLGVAAKLLKKNEGGRGRHLSADVFKDSEAMAKQLFGMASAYTLYNLFDSGVMTAGYPKDAAERQRMIDAQIPEFGLKTPAGWIDWGRVEPFASVAIGIGTFHQRMKEYEQDVKDKGKKREMMDIAKDLGASTADALSKALVQRQFLYGLSTALNALNAPAEQGEQYVRQFVGNVAAPALVAGVARSFDPNQRKINSVSDAVQNRIPGLRNQLPAEYKTFGGARENPQAGATAFVPLLERSGEQTPLQQFVEKIGYKKAPLSKTVEGIQLNPKEYEMYSRIANEEVTKTLERRYEALQANERISNERKAYLMEKWTDEARTKARKIFLREIQAERPDIRKDIRNQKRRDKGLEVYE